MAWHPDSTGAGNGADTAGSETGTLAGTSPRLEPAGPPPDTSTGGTSPAGWLGVIGGMGPLATADFLAKLALATPAANDQEHIPVLLYGDCTTPDRTQAALGRGASPLPRLRQAVAFLASQGVQTIAMPCNSAHAWYDEVAATAAQAGCRVLHIVDASVQRLRQLAPAVRRVGVLSTEGTARMGIYAQRLERLGLQPLAPQADEFAAWVSPSIAHIKAGNIAAAEQLLERAAMCLMDRGAEAVILGCTELPLGLRHQVQTQPQRYVDSTEALVRAVLAVMRPARQAAE